MFQTEEEAKLKEQVMTLSKDLNSEKNRCAELQKTGDGTKESLATLQSDYYGKESELSAVRQDLKVCFIKYKHILIWLRAVLRAVSDYYLIICHVGVWREAGSSSGGAGGQQKPA